jgi:protein-disulfide isomerase/uncharacterized membrane protein
MIRILHIVALVILSLTGMFASGVLLYEHLFASPGHSWQAAACGEGSEGGVSNCEQVMHSRWGKILWMPTAFWGSLYYSALTLWFLFIGRPSFDRRYWHIIPTLGVLMGASASVFFIVIMYAQLQQWCFWCMVSHVAGFLILILTLLLWPRRRTAERERIAAAAPATVRRPARPHPSVRLVLAVSLTVVLTGVCFGQVVVGASVLTKMEMLKAITRVMYEIYQDDLRDRIRTRPDDPVKFAGDDGERLRAVVFSNFTCLHCRQFAESVDGQFSPLFDNHLEVVFKHFPLCSECNPWFPEEGDPDACRAARAAEAARMQGGNDAFWKAHDLLFSRARQRRLRQTDYRELAGELELDPERFVADMESDEVARRIQEDVDLGHALGVTSTPGVFVGNRHVPNVAALEPYFWQAVAQMYEAKARRRNGGADPSAVTAEDAAAPPTASLTARPLDPRPE